MSNPMKALSGSVVSLASATTRTFNILDHVAGAGEAHAAGMHTTAHLVVAVNTLRKMQELKEECNDMGVDFAAVQASVANAVAPQYAAAKPANTKPVRTKAKPRK